MQAPLASGASRRQAQRACICAPRFARRSNVSLRAWWRNGDSGARNSPANTSACASGSPSGAWRAWSNVPARERSSSQILGGHRGVQEAGSRPSVPMQLGRLRSRVSCAPWSHSHPRLHWESSVERSAWRCCASGGCCAPSARKPTKKKPRKRPEPRQHDRRSRTSSVPAEAAAGAPDQCTVTVQPSEFRTMGGWMCVSAVNRCGET